MGTREEKNERTKEENTPTPWRGSLLTFFTIVIPVLDDLSYSNNRAPSLPPSFPHPCLERYQD